MAASTVVSTTAVIALLVWAHTVEARNERSSERAADVVTAAHKLDATVILDLAAPRADGDGPVDAVTRARGGFTRSIAALQAIHPTELSDLLRVAGDFDVAVASEQQLFAEGQRDSAARVEAVVAATAFDRLIESSNREITRLRQQADKATLVSWWAAMVLVIAQTLGVLLLARTLHRDRQRRRVAGVTIDAERRFESMVRNVDGAIGVWDHDGRISYVSPGIEEMLGYAPAEVMTWSQLDHIHPDDIAAVVASAEALTEPGHSVRMTYRVQHRDGRWRTLDNTVRNLIDDPAIKGFVWNARDITEQNELEAQLAFQAFHDPLTGLANRALLHDRVGHALERSRRSGTNVGVVYIDLDGFKSINEMVDHVGGDELLVTVAARLVLCLRPGDTLARVGGDEFAAVLEDVGDATAVVVAAERLVDVLRAPFHVEGREVFITASAGISLTDDAQETVDALLRDADAAMRVAKARGTDRVELFEAAMQRHVVDRAEMICDLHHAIERGELRVQFQPTVEIASGRIEGAEALVRWHHPTRGIIPPAVFIPLAESSGQIIPIGRWVLDEACRAASSWPSDLTLAVNLSTRQLQDSNLISDLADTLLRSGIRPQGLVLEVTESALMDDPVTGLQRLNAVKLLGVRLAVDDFGTGYSSLAQLQTFPVDIIKIDKVFIDTITSKPDGDAFVRAIIQLAHAVGLDTIAEGVEDIDQMRALETIGCRFAQGFLFATPLDPDEFVSLVRGGAPDALVAPGSSGVRRGLAQGTG